MRSAVSAGSPTLLRQSSRTPANFRFEQHLSSPISKPIDLCLTKRICPRPTTFTLKKPRICPIYIGFCRCRRLPTRSRQDGFRRVGVGRSRRDRTAGCEHLAKENPATSWRPKQTVRGPRKVTREASRA
ncbi:unnamed protein product [Amoebophrya sp. A25]|nr:unnamed protein product [Amoebophrya sp. A25]|eukprot:GSA25T00018756001.1